MSEILKVKEVAAELRVHYKTVLDWISSHKLKARRFGVRSYRICREDLDSFLAASEVGTEVGTEENISPVQIGSRPLPNRAPKTVPARKAAWERGWHQRFGGRR